MTKVKSSSAGVSVKTTKAAASKGEIKQSASSASKTAREVARQQKKTSTRKIDQTGRSETARENISALSADPDSPETTKTTLANSVLSAALLNSASAASPSSHSNVDRNQDRALTGNPRAGSKLAIVLGMLREDGGASIDAIMQATGWLSHTTRAVLTGLKKRGYVIERQAGEKDSPSIYRIMTEVTDATTISSSPSASKRAA